ncbi:MAG: hypothetical protein Q8S84_01370 [bacterium]|nr:hypothetical protein [bacterium]MDP3380222.1 hypothetical protein [bacterium]
MYSLFQYSCNNHSILFSFGVTNLSLGSGSFCKLFSFKNLFINSSDNQTKSSGFIQAFLNASL